MALLNDKKPVHQGVLGSCVPNSHTNVVFIVSRQNTTGVVDYWILISKARKHGWIGLLGEIRCAVLAEIGVVLRMSILCAHVERREHILNCGILYGTLRWRVCRSCRSIRVFEDIFAPIRSVTVPELPLLNKGGKRLAACVQKGVFFNIFFLKC